MFNLLEKQGGKTWRSLVKAKFQSYLIKDNVIKEVADKLF